MGTSFGKWEGAFAETKAPGLMSGILEQIALDQRLHQFIPVQLADHASGIVVVGDIGGIFRKQITDDLINGIVTFFLQGVEHRAQDPAHAIPVVAGDCEFLCALVRHDFDLLMVIVVLYPKKGKL
jgi:hypothetical protein